MENLSPTSLIIITGLITFLPIAIGIGTSYLKVSIVLSVLKNALGTQQVPSQLLVMVLSVGVSIFIMSSQIQETFAAAKSIEWSMIGKDTINEGEKALNILVQPLTAFLNKHAGQREIEVLQGIVAEIEEREQVESTKQALSTRVLILAYILSELKEAFSMAFVVLLPFLVIDLIVANILVGLGMFMVSPVMIALPLKILLFVVSDAWILLIKGLILSYY